MCINGHFVKVIKINKIKPTKINEKINIWSPKKKKATRLGKKKSQHVCNKERKNKRKKKEEEEEEKKQPPRWRLGSKFQGYFWNLLVFSSFLGENFLVGSRRKYLSLTIYFPSSLSNQTHFKKVFLPIFSPKFSIHPISPPNKHTLSLS